MAERRTQLYLVGAAAVVIILAAVIGLVVRNTGDSDDFGSRDDPLPIGSTVDLGNNWSVTVNAADTSADAAVAAAEAFNDPPEPGKRYVVVNVSATNNGNTADAPEIDVSLFGSSGVEHDGGNFVTPPDPRFDTVTELEPGAATAGNLVFVVDTAESDLGVRLQPLIAVDGDPTWIALGD